MILGIIVGVVGVVMAIEGLIILISPSVTVTWMKRMIKSYSRWKWFGFVEFIVGIILILISIVFRGLAY